MNNIPQKPYKPLTPFGIFVKHNFPFTEATYEARDNYDLLCKVMGQLNKVKYNQGIAQENIEALYNFLNTLDLQDEVNNKLDEMAESGELQEIMADYLNANANWCFDTVQDMKNATNLIDGSYAKTLGYYNVNDGGESQYYISSSEPTNEYFYETLPNNLYAILICTPQEVRAKQLGCIGDKTTDTTIQLQNAIDFCLNSQRDLIIDGIFKTTTPINTKGVKLKGLTNNNPVGVRVYTSEQYGYIGFDYLNNTGSGALITFEDYISDVVTYGNGIISETANPIIYCNSSSAKKLDLENIFVCGWLRSPNQVGIEEVIDDDTMTYINGYNTFNNVNVFNCGGDGIKLHSIESQNWTNLSVRYNGGHGLNVVADLTKDTPIDYTTISNSNFSCNAKNGVNLYRTFRKNLSFINCKASDAGMYSIRGQAPNNIVTAYCGFYVYGGNPKPANTIAQQNLIFDNCSGEYTEKLIHVETLGTSENTTLNFLEIKNCTSFRYSSNDSCLAYINIDYSKTLSLYDNYTTAPTFYKFGDKSKNGTLIPLINDDKFNEAYSSYLTPTISHHESLNVTVNNIYRRGDIITFFFNALATDNISAWATLFNNMPIPITDTIIPIMIANTPYRATVYTGRNVTCPQAITSGQNVILSGSYVVKHLSNKNGQ